MAAGKDGKTSNPDRKPEKMVSTEAVRKGPARRAGNWFWRMVLIPLALLLLLLFSAIYFVRGYEFESEAVTAKIRDSLQAVIGANYRLEIAGTGFSLSSYSNLSLSGRDVTVFDVNTNARVATLSTVKIGLDPVSLLRGEMRFDRLFIADARLELPTQTEQGNVAFRNLRPALLGLGKGLSRLEQTLARGSLNGLRLERLSVNPGAIRSRNDSPLLIDFVELDHEGGGKFSVAAEARTELSQLTINAEWRLTPGGGRQLTGGVGPLNSLEWLRAVDPPEGEKRGLAVETSFRLDWRIPFDADMEPQQPYVKIQADPGKLRVGRRGEADLQFALFNLRLYPQSDKIELERSELVAGDVRFLLTGELAPTEATAGFGGPMSISLLAESIRGNPHYERDEPLTASAVFEGIWTPDERTLALDVISLETQSGSAVGGMTVQFTGRSPGVYGTVSATELSASAAKQFWPFHIAVGARRWARRNLQEGTIRNLSADFSIAPGRMAEVADGGQLEPDELQLSFTFQNAQSAVLGELPPIQGASGSFSLAGPQLDVHVESGRFNAPDGSGLVPASGRFSIGQVFRRPLQAKVEVLAEAGLRPLMSVINAEPLKIAEKIAVRPEWLSGKAEAGVEASFPIGVPDVAKQLVWSATVDLAEANSSEPVFGRKLKNANLDIVAKNGFAEIDGEVIADGIPVVVDLTEPLPGADSRLRSRSVTAQLTTTQMADLGLPVEPVIRGNVSVAFDEDRDGTFYRLNLADSDLSLPWINWLKGRGIPGEARFELIREDGVNRLKDFVLTGRGFAAEGNLAFDKTGLISADLRNVKLVGDDQFEVSVKRSSGRYSINATGRSFDGRAMIDRIIHQDGFADGRAATDVSVQANFANLVGFNGQVMETMRLSYRTDGGLLSEFEVRGALQGRVAAINASRDGETLMFSFSSDNAGAGLAMADLYRKMKGGVLKSRLQKTGSGPFTGRVRIQDFVVEGEERLASLAAAPVADNQFQAASGKLQQLELNTVNFDELRADISKGPDSFEVSGGRIRNAQIGLTFEGALYDPRDRMSIRGTFMPLFTISRLIGGIPIIGDIFSNGRDSGLIGITYRLSGPAKNPSIEVNPLSIVAPGIFRQIFEFQE